VELRVEPLVDEHLHRDPAVREEGGRHARGDRRCADRRPHLQPVEIHLAVRQEEKVPGERIAHVELLRAALRRCAEEERIAPVGTRPRRGHLEPERAFVGAKCVPYADRDDATRARLQTDTSPVEVQHRPALEHVEARLVGVDVLVHVAAGKRNERECHVRRAEGAADQPARREAARVSRQGLRQLDVRATDEPVRRATVAELARAGVSAHLTTPACHRGCRGR
jgi:hypothetical protein